MMKWIMLLLLTPLWSFGQIEFSAKKHDFGDMDALADGLIDITLTNKSDEKVFILRVQPEGQIRYLYSNRTIGPHSSETLRLKINPTEEGRFKHDVWVFLSSSNEATIIKLTGNVTEKPRGGVALACPDFSGSTTMAEQLSFDFKINVLDADTKKPIHRANVMIVRNGRPAFDWKTNRDGRIEKEFPLGYYYFVSKATGYESKEFAALVNRKNDVLTIELVPNEIPEEIFVDHSGKDTSEQVAVIDDSILEEPIDSVVEDFEEIVFVLEPEDPVEVVEVDVEVPLDEEIDVVLKDSVIRKPGEFDLNVYAPTNVVMVLDISASMKRNGKLDLLKTSMLELISMLRPEDRIGMVSFASDARVISRPVSATAANKKMLENIIEGLEADGQTNGAGGIKNGYKMAMSEYFDSGNNTIILTSDGAFNEEGGSFYRTIDKGVSKDITISVLGIKADKVSERELRALAELGHGRYTAIEDYESAMKVLKEEIKTSSKK